jgi:hypothetical protein
VTARPTTSIVRVMAAALVVSAPLTLIAPKRIYADLVEPSLIALWLSQLLVFAAYPRFAAKVGESRIVSTPLAVTGVAFTVFGIYAATQSAGS